MRLNAPICWLVITTVTVLLCVPVQVFSGTVRPGEGTGDDPRCKVSEDDFLQGNRPDSKCKVKRIECVCVYDVWSSATSSYVTEIVRTSTDQCKLGVNCYGEIGGQTNICCMSPTYPCDFGGGGYGRGEGGAPRGGYQFRGCFPAFPMIEGGPVDKESTPISWGP